MVRYSAREKEMDEAEERSRGVQKRTTRSSRAAAASAVTPKTKTATKRKKKPAAKAKGAAKGKGKKGKAEKKLSEEQISRAKDVFQSFDTDMTGTIEAKDLQFALSALGWCPEQAQVVEYLEKARRNKSGILSYEEFLAAAKPILLEQEEEERMKHAFALFSGGKTRITMADLKQAVTLCGEEMEEEELQEMIGCADPTGKGYVSEKDFMRLVME